MITSIIIIIIIIIIINILKLTRLNESQGFSQCPHIFLVFDVFVQGFAIRLCFRNITKWTWAATVYVYPRNIVK
jgi:hypothetical protein